MYAYPLICLVLERPGYCYVELHYYLCSSDIYWVTVVKFGLYTTSDCDICLLIIEMVKTGRQNFNSQWLSLLFKILMAV